MPPNPRRPRQQTPQRRGAGAQDRPRERPPIAAPARRRSTRTNEQNQTLLLIAGGVVVLALLVVGFGYYVQYLRKPALPVAVVDGHTISAQDYQLETKLRNADLEGRGQALQTRLSAAPNDPDLKRQVQTLQGELGASTDQATSDLIDRYLVSLALPALRQQGAPAAGFVVGDQDVAARLAQWKANNNVATDAAYRQVLDRIGVSDGQLRDYFRAQILNERVEAYVARDVAATQPEVKAAQLVIADKAKADEALGKLKANGDFETIVQQYSTDDTVKAAGGELGWQPKGYRMVGSDIQMAAIDPAHETWVTFTVEQVPTWVRVYARDGVTLWSGDDTRATQLGHVPQWGYLRVEWSEGSRVCVYNPLTKNWAYASLEGAGPSGPAPGYHASDNSPVPARGDTTAGGPAGTSATTTSLPPTHLFGAG